MSEKDFAVSSVGLPSVASPPKKPCYLVALTDPSGKAKIAKHFIALDKPESLNGFINTKGFYSDESEENIVKGFVELVSSNPKESILDMSFPWHRVLSIRSLVFNANKATTLVR